MKRTSTMYVWNSHESHELMLYAVNNSELYFKHIIPVIKNLAKKYNKGTFDDDKAIDAFWYVAQAANKAYLKDFGHSFTVQERFTAAAEMIDYFWEEIENGAA